MLFVTILSALVFSIWSHSHSLFCQTTDLSLSVLPDWHSLSPSLFLSFLSLSLLSLPLLSSFLPPSLSFLFPSFPFSFSPFLTFPPLSFLLSFSFSLYFSGCWFMNDPPAFYCSYLPLKHSFHTVFAVFLSFVLCCFPPFFSAVTNHLFPLFCLLIQINHSLQFLSVVFFLSLSLFPLATQIKSLGLCPGWSC